MAKTGLLGAVNAEMGPKLGYNPYELVGGGIACASCHNLLTKDELNQEFMTRTKKVIGPDGKEHEVHACPKCNYTSKGVNVQLRRRITEMRKKLGVYEVNSGKFKNEYFTPGTYYFTVDGNEKSLFKTTEAEMIDTIQKRENAVTVADDETVEAVSPVEEKSEPVVEEQPTQEETKEEEVDEQSVEAVESDKENNEEETVEEGSGEESGVDGSSGQMDTETEEQQEVAQESTEESETLTIEVDEDDEELAQAIESGDVEVISEEEPPVATAPNYFIGAKDGAAKEVKTKEPNYSNIGDNSVVHMGVQDDPVTAEMIRQNAERAANDVFKIKGVGKDQIYGIISKTRAEILREEFNSSNAKSVVDLILNKFEQFGRPLKHKIYIGDATHECPVVDLEGNIRLVFVDLDKSGGQYNVTAEINRRLKSTFRKGARFEMMTFTIYSDMISTGDNIRRVVKGVIKHIVHNLEICDVVTPISIFHQSENYFYTTSEFDKPYIDAFIEKNSPGNVLKPSTDVVAIINSWKNPEATDEELRYRQLNVMNQLARNNEIDYSALSMYMTCAMKYIANEDTDGNVLVVITDYIETLDLFIRDGFGACLGLVIHNVRSKYPNRIIKVYYELDITMIPSPTVHRYIADGNLKVLNPDIEVMNFNKISSMIAKDHGIKNIQEIPIEGKEFLKPEYMKPFWRSIQKSPNFRAYYGDEKRLDWRRFAPKNFSKTLGEQMRGQTINVNDKSARNEMLEKLGYRHISQPKVDVLVVTNNLLNVCFNAVNGYENLIGCTGRFSLSEYVSASRSNVVGNNYGFNRPNNDGSGFGGYYSNPNVPPWIQQPTMPFMGQPMDPMAVLMRAYSQTAN